MLVLSRTLDETIMVGDSIEITILEVKGDKVKIGVKAPMEIPVHRKEIYLAIKRENIEATGIETSDLAKAASMLLSKHKDKNQKEINQKKSKGKSSNNQQGG